MEAYELFSIIEIDNIAYIFQGMIELKKIIDSATDPYYSISKLEHQPASVLKDFYKN